MTGIFSFIIFLPCVFKENHFVRHGNLNNEESNTENTRRSSVVEYLAASEIRFSKILDLKFGDSKADTNEKKKDSVASIGTTSSGFVSVDTKSTPRNFWSKINQTFLFLSNIMIYYYRLLCEVLYKN